MLSKIEVLFEHGQLSIPRCMTLKASYLSKDLGRRAERSSSQSLASLFATKQQRRPDEFKMTRITHLAEVCAK